MLKHLQYFILFGIVYKHFRVRVYGSIAQLGEHLPYKQGVTGSSPVVPTIYLREWLSGRASPCQGERREFESRFPLHNRRYSQAVRPRSAKPLRPGSNPGGASKRKSTSIRSAFFYISKPTAWVFHLYKSQAKE